MASQKSNKLSLSIVGLNQGSRPSTILFAVIAVIVNTINGSIFYPIFITMIQVGSIHIPLKVRKIIPKILNAPTPIAGIFKMFGFITSIINVYKNSIKTSVRHFMSTIIARFSDSTNNSISSNYFFSPTITFKKPIILSILNATRSYSSKLIKFLTSNVFSKFFRSKFSIIATTTRCFTRGYSVFTYNLLLSAIASKNPVMVMILRIINSSYPNKFYGNKTTIPIASNVEGFHLLQFKNMATKMVA